MSALPLSIWPSSHQTCHLFKNNHPNEYKMVMHCGISFKKAFFYVALGALSLWQSGALHTNVLLLTYFSLIFPPYNDYSNPCPRKTIYLSIYLFLLLFNCRNFKPLWICLLLIRVMISSMFSYAIGGLFTNAIADEQKPLVLVCFCVVWHGLDRFPEFLCWEFNSVHMLMMSGEGEQHCGR